MDLKLTDATLQTIDELVETFPPDVQEKVRTALCAAAAMEREHRALMFVPLVLSSEKAFELAFTQLRACVVKLAGLDTDTGTIATERVMEHMAELRILHAALSELEQQLSKLRTTTSAMQDRKVTVN